MGRIARVVAPGMPHHVTQRGNRRQKTFFMAESDDAELAAALRRHENTGRPLGERPFLERIGVLLGRDLLPAKRGRPKKDGN